MKFARGASRVLLEFIVGGLIFLSVIGVIGVVMFYVIPFLDEHQEVLSYFFLVFLVLGTFITCWAMGRDFMGSIKRRRQK